MSLVLIFCSCSTRLINQIKQEESLSSSASIVADSLFFKEASKSPYWLEKVNIQFLYSSFFGLDQNSVYLQKGAEESKIFITQPTVIWGQTINRPILLYPNDKIAIQMKEFGDVEFVGADEKRTKELHSFAALDEMIQERLPASFFLPQYQSVKAASSISKNDNLVTSQLNSQWQLLRLKIDSLTTADRISPEFQSEMINYLAAKIFALKVEYFWATKKYFSGNVPKKRYAELISYGNLIKSHSELKFYYSSLRDLLSFLTYSGGRVSSIYDPASFRLFLQTVKDNFHGITKNFLIADVLYTALRNKIISPGGVEIYSKKECNDKTYRLALKNLARSSDKSEKYAMAENGKFLLPFASSAAISADKLLDSYKGKLVLVDFWASWCIPCRQELPLMRELKRLYAGKDIVFLTISIDNKFLEWQKASNAEKLSSDESFVITSTDSVFVFKGYSIKNIPRYLLFNKDGSLIDADAPSPGTNALKEMIDKYLY